MRADAAGRGVAARLATCAERCSETRERFVRARDEKLTLFATREFLQAKGASAELGACGGDADAYLGAVAPLRGVSALRFFHA